MRPAELVQALEWRYATKRFDPSKKISADVWQSLEEALRLSPSSFGLQLWKFIVIDDSKLRERLRPHTWDQDQVTACSHLVVFANKVTASDPEVIAHIRNISDTRQVPVETLDAYRNRITDFVNAGDFRPEISHWTSKQTYIALGIFMASCAVLGVDTCPMEGFERERYDDVLGLAAEGLSVSVLCAAGYRASDDRYQHAKKVRYAKSDIITHR